MCRGKENVQGMVKHCETGRAGSWASKERLPEPGSSYSHRKRLPGRSCVLWKCSHCQIMVKQKLKRKNKHTDLYFLPLELAEPFRSQRTMEPNWCCLYKSSPKIEKDVEWNWKGQQNSLPFFSLSIHCCSCQDETPWSNTGEQKVLSATRSFLGDVDSVRVLPET